MADIKIVEWSLKRPSAVVNRFLKRPAFSEVAEGVAVKVLADVRKRGNAAVCDCAQKFDGVALTAGKLKVQPKELLAAREEVAPAFRAAVREAHRRIVAFSRKGMRQDWRMASPRGGSLGEIYHPYDRVGAYIPGGAAPLASTALMTVTLAKVAGVPEIVACTPCGPDGIVDPHILHALDVAGATEVYRVGGIHSIGLMAYGTRTIPKVQKIVGPGGAYVTAAKRQVYGHVALDLVAGPSEIAVLADAEANPAYVAADLLSQAEHGTGDEKALCVTTSMTLARKVRDQVLQQIEVLSRREAVERVLKSGALIVVVPNVDQGMELCNRFAAEHLELMVQQPQSWLKKVRSAGAVFVGQWTPEAAGDFVAGPSHVLPTGGAAAMFSGLTVDDFLRRSSFISFTKADLKDTVEHIRVLAEVEGLDAHARSATIRFDPS
jgi:histidinol dehydrogenase